MLSISNVTVLGAGVLGGQIAWHSAFKGKTVVVYDISKESLDNCRRAHEQYAAIYQKDVGASAADIAATKSRLSFSTDVKTAANADLIIEAVPEIPEVKTRVYTELAPHMPDHTIVASNSSTLLPSDFAVATGRPEKYCALHFANLIWIMNVVEVMAHPTTSKDTLTAVTEFGIEIGMLPVAVQKESSGYLLNAWFVALLDATLALVVNGVGHRDDIDRTYMMVNRGCSMGPCGLIDMVGMKTVYDASVYWGTVNNNEQQLQNAAWVKENFIDKGSMGLHTGEGFYKYPNPEFSRDDFLAVPAMSKVPEIVNLAMPK